MLIYANEAAIDNATKGLIGIGSKLVQITSTERDINLRVRKNMRAHETLRAALLCSGTIG
jgi:hypothetical protein